MMGGLGEKYETGGLSVKRVGEAAMYLILFLQANSLAA